MMAKRLLIRLGIASAAIAGLVLLIAWWPKGTGEAAAGGDTWTCSMHPQVRMNRPGDCPTCGMKLIPASKLPPAKGSGGGAGLETAAIARRELFKEIQTVGKLDYNESRVEDITSRIAGRVERLYVDFTGIEVKESDHLVDIYSPDLYSAEAELIRALEAFEAASKKGSDRLVDRFAEANLLAAREKLRLWGLLPEQIAEVEKLRKERTHVTIYSPLAGTVIAKNVRLGQYVKEGDPLYRVAELDPIWLYLDLYEYDIGWVRYGQPVEVTLEAFRSETFRGIVTFIDPFLDDRSRTVKVRVNLKNADRRLKPGMYASAKIRVRLLADGGPAPTGLEGKYSCPMHPEVIQDEAGKCSICKMDLIPIPKSGPFAAVSVHQHGEHDHAQHATETKKATEPKTADAAADTSLNPLAIPASAVLDTGRRQIAYRQTKDGNFELVELHVGPQALSVDESGRATNHYPVLHGLSEKDRVVVQGGFLLDSQTQIEGRPSLLFPTGQTGANLHSSHSMPATKVDSNQSMPAGHKH